MPREKFNPLDPLGLFKKDDEEARYQDLVPERRPGWRPPDPLHIFERAPDPLGLFHRKGNSGYHGSGATIGNPIPIEWADQIIPLKNQAREVLVAKGYPPKQVDMALHWAEEWLMGMARRMAPNNRDLQRSVVVSGYSEIAGRAEKWLQGIEAAFSVSPQMLAV
jgi:hypothetical protein